MKTMEKGKYLAEVRKQRENALKGKFVIVQNSRYNKNQIMYLQDSDLAAAQGNAGKNWTLFLANAKGFDNEYVAKSIAKKFKYNNVRVETVR